MSDAKDSASVRLERLAAQFTQRCQVIPTQVNGREEENNNGNANDDDDDDDDSDWDPDDDKQKEKEKEKKGKKKGKEEGKKEGKEEEVEEEEEEEKRIPEVWPLMVGIRAAIKQWFQWTVLPDGLHRRQAQFGWGIFASPPLVFKGAVETRLLGTYGGFVMYDPAKRFNSSSDKIIEFEVWNQKLWVDGNISKGDDVGLLPKLLRGNAVSTVMPAIASEEEEHPLDVDTWIVTAQRMAPRDEISWAAYMNHKWDWPLDPPRIPEVRSTVPLAYKSVFANCHVMNAAAFEPTMEVGNIYFTRHIEDNEELTFDYGRKYWAGRATMHNPGPPTWDWTHLSAQTAMALGDVNGVTELIKQSVLLLPAGLAVSESTGKIVRRKSAPQKKKQRLRMASLQLTTPS